MIVASSQLVKPDRSRRSCVSALVPKKASGKLVHAVLFAFPMLYPFRF